LHGQHPSSPAPGAGAFPGGVLVAGDHRRPGQPLARAAGMVAGGRAVGDRNGRRAGSDGGGPVRVRAHRRRQPRPGRRAPAHAAGDDGVGALRRQPAAAAAGDDAGRACLAGACDQRRRFPLPRRDRMARRQAGLPAPHRRDMTLPITTHRVGRGYAPDGFWLLAHEARPDDLTRKAVGGVAPTYGACRYSRSVGSSAPASGCASGTYRPGGPISQRQNTHASSANSAEASARWIPLWLSSGDSTPATAAFITSPVNACNDEAEPRWRGYMSSTARVRIGNTSAMPNEPIDIGSTAHGIDGTGTNRL